MTARGQVLRIFALVIAAAALAIGNRAIGVVPARSSEVVAAPASERLPGSPGTSLATRRLERAVNALGPDLEGLDTDDLEKREDDLNDDLENTKQRKAAIAKLDQLEQGLRLLRDKLSDIRSAALVGINPASVLDQVHALGAGILAIENGIDELDELVKAAERFEDDDDD